MAQMAMAQNARIPKNFRTVITAAAGGNVIEWYDFYIFGSLATILSVKFFEKSHPVAALLSTIALFTAGFLVRPLGAFVFGWMGDRVGRKYTFLLTLVGMAVGTGAIGLIPTFEQIGLAAAFILFGLRMVQGLCLGGSYGGAITYVAEHVPEERRGYYTGWLQTSPTLGIVLSLIIIIATRTYFGEKVFNDWAWRIPFLCSFFLLLVTMYMRRNFEESPVYEEIKAKGKTSKNPWREAFLNPANLKYVVIATIVVLGEGVLSNQLPTIAPTDGELRFNVTHAPYLVGTVGWWPLDGNGKDIFGGLDGLVTGELFWFGGKVDRSFIGNGVRSGVVVPANPAVDVGQSGGFSVEGWVFPMAVSNAAPWTWFAPERVLMMMVPGRFIFADELFVSARNSWTVSRPGGLP